MGARLSSPSSYLRADKQKDVNISALTIGGLVRAIAVAPNGDVYVGGAFTNGAGNPDIDYIARWDGTSWHSLGKGLAAANDWYRGVWSIAINGSKVYVDGSFATTGDGVELNNFARWDMNTNSWEPLMYPCTGAGGSCGPGITTGIVYALAAPTSGGGVYVGGDFTPPYLAPSGLKHIGFYDGTAWSALGPGVCYTCYGDVVLTLFVDPLNGSLYAGGKNLEAYEPGQYDQWGNILRWNGSTWQKIEGTWNIAGPVYDITGDNGDIYVAGALSKRVGTNGTGSAIYAYGVVKYDGANWTKLGSNPVGDTATFPFTDARAVGICQSNIYLGGFFDDPRPGMISHRFARWNGSAWDNAGASLSNWDSDAGITSIAVNGSQAYVGGNFVNAGGNPDADYIARFDGTHWYALTNPTPTPTSTPIAPTATPTAPPSNGGTEPTPIPKPPVVKAIGTTGHKGSTVKLPFKLTYLGAGTSEQITISKGKTLVRLIKGSYSAVKSGATYFFTINLAGLAKGTYQYCVVSTDNYSRKSNKSCAPLEVR